MTSVLGTPGINTPEPGTHCQDTYRDTWQAGVVGAALYLGR